MRAAGDGAVAQHLVQSGTADAHIGGIAIDQPGRGHACHAHAGGGIDFDRVEADA